MKLLIAAIAAAAGLTGCVGYVPVYGSDAYATSPAYSAVPGYGYGYPAYPSTYSAPYYYGGPSVSLGAVVAPRYGRRWDRDDDDRRWHR